MQSMITKFENKWKQYIFKSLMFKGDQIIAQPYSI